MITIPEKKSINTFCNCCNKSFSGSSTLNRCHNIDAAKLLITSYLPLYDSWGRIHLHFSIQPETLSKKIFPVFQHIMIYPRNTPNILNPSKFQEQYCETFGGPPYSQSPIKKSYTLQPVYSRGRGLLINLKG